MADDFPWSITSIIFVAKGTSLSTIKIIQRPYDK